MNTNLRLAVIGTVLLLVACATPADKGRQTAAVAPAQRCTVSPGGTAGRCYTSDDISRTGASTLGGALPLLDSSISVHR